MLTASAQELGLRVVWAAHAHLDAGLAPAGVDVRRCFGRCFFDLEGEQAGTVDLSPDLLEGWKAILAEFDDADTHILMHSADAHQLRAAAAVFQTGPGPRAVVHINFQTSPRFMPGRLAGEDVHAAVLRLRKAPAWERSLFFWAETRRLASWLSDWLGEDIPAPPFLGVLSAAASRQRDAGGPITLAFLGEGRSSKGFLDLPDIADHIAARPSLVGAVRLAIQNWPPFRGDLVKHEAAIARLTLHPFVKIVDGVLAPPAYEALLNGADILLLPYLPQTYGLQGSGILVEGLARGKIIIARSGTAAVDEARAGVGFAYRAPGELAEGLEAIIDDYPELAASAASLAEKFRQKNNPRRFLCALAARAQGLAW
jgi:glycosyltransferase involved in cell wall biosynthesis